MNFAEAVQCMLDGNKVQLPPHPDRISDWYSAKCSLEIYHNNIVYNSEVCDKIRTCSSAGSQFINRNDWLLISTKVNFVEALQYALDGEIVWSPTANKNHNSAMKIKDNMLYISCGPGAPENAWYSFLQSSQQFLLKQNDFRIYK